MFFIYLIIITIGCLTPALTIAYVIDSYTDAQANWRGLIEDNNLHDVDRPLTRYLTLKMIENTAFVTQPGMAQDTLFCSHSTRLLLKTSSAKYEIATSEQAAADKEVTHYLQRGYKFIKHLHTAPQTTTKWNAPL